MQNMKNINASQTAAEFHSKLATIDITVIPVMSRDRLIPRKQQAALARQLFKQLGLKGISVTAPNYSMAQSVDVRPPKRNDYQLDGQGFMIPGDPAAEANSVARQRLESILLAAFPQHDNRSDSMTDYFDYCWSIA